MHWLSTISRFLVGLSGVLPRGSPVSILYESIAGSYRPVRVADGPITARYRFIKNASWEHIVKLEITWQLPRSTTTRRSNQCSKRKMLADGVTCDKDGVTKMADQSKMAAPTLPTTTDTLNVARCASPSASSESREKTPPRPTTPSTAAVTTADQPLEGEWTKVLTRKKSTPKKPSRASTPKEQPMSQRKRTPSPPKKVQRLKWPVPQVPSGKEEKTTTGAGKAFPLHEKYDLDEVVSGTTKVRRKYYIVKANKLPRFEEEINVDLPAYFGCSSRDPPLKPSTRSFTRGWRSSINKRDHVGMQSTGTTSWTAPVRVPTLQLRLSTR